MMKWMKGFYVVASTKTQTPPCGSQSFRGGRTGSSAWERGSFQRVVGALGWPRVDDSRLTFYSRRGQTQQDWQWMHSRMRGAAQTTTSRPEPLTT